MLNSLKLFSYFTLLLGVSAFPSQIYSPPLPNDGKIWVLLVAGSEGYGNYRHQADLCHAYQILHANGIPDENIITMMVDDIANSSENPTPGVIINAPGGKNVYQGVPKDYTGKDVNSKNFLHVLTGNKAGVQGVGTGRVIESGPNDHIFINFVDHGGPGKQMSSKNKYAKMILYIEACYSGSMFDNLLDDDLNIFVTTAADPHESSYACYYDDTRNTYLGDVFSVVWMEDMSKESPAVNDLHHQFERVRTRTNTSHVEEYGDLDIGTTKLKDVVGLQMRKELAANGYDVKQVPILDSHDNIHVPVQILKNQLEKYKEPKKRQELKLQMRALEKKRNTVDDVFADIIDRVVNEEIEKAEVTDAKYSLNTENFPCYKQLMSSFHDRCFNIAQNPYVRVHLQKFVNMCGISTISTEKALKAIESSCDEPTRYVNFFAQ
uniref:Secreted C13 protease-like protein n=1 Tax=Pristhesancus plagipennis TaxID=1955184 RepID=A0A2K8JWF4_PRIPG|nr:secreted C13 protease-like protein [Pristhesancus plagipennis]